MSNGADIAGAALVKLYGIKALLGMAGAALLFMAAPPLDANGNFDKKEFALRLACAGVFSVMFGDWVLFQVVTHAPWLHAQSIPKAVDLMTGAPAWWITRGVALWLQRRSRKDIGEVIDDFRGLGK